MIPYIEIIDKNSLKTKALIEPSECWFEVSYYDIGEFEIYCRASMQNLEALKKGNYARIPNKNFIWVIEAISYEFNAEGSRMISAKGREAKCIINKRIIKKQIELPNDIATAVFNLIRDNVSENAIEQARQIQHFKTELSSYTETIKDTQATRGNLGEFINNLLKTYKWGSSVFFEDGEFVHRSYKGKDKRSSVKFSQSMDNLIKSDFYTSDKNKCTNALIISTVDDVDYPQEYDQGAAGIDRSEILIESNLSTEYTPEGATEARKLDLKNKPEDKELYNSWQREEGKQKLAEHTTEEEINGEIDLHNSAFKFGVDFFIGDIVRIQDEYFNFYKDARILKFTIKQGTDGYGEEADYGDE